jgi:hypothetical protein
MVNKQQMRWTPRGAHLLLQVRTRVINDQLADDFHRWYRLQPGAGPRGARGVASLRMFRSPFFGSDRSTPETGNRQA